MIARHFNLITVVSHQPTQFIQAGQSPLIVISPLSSECRDGVIHFRQLGPQVVRVTNVKQPTITLLHGYSAVAECVAEQREISRVSTGLQMPGWS